MARMERRDAELLGLLKASAARAMVRDAEPPVLRSEWGEDLLILELFGWQRAGFYIEVGAYDGRLFAVTAALDRLGWQGLLIEPVPDLYERAKQNRPNARVVNAAVSRKGSSGTVTMSHILPRGAYAADACSHITTNEEKVATKRPPPGEVRQIEVPLTTIDDLLSGQVDRVEFASIDVEGHELDLLDGFDLDRFRPRALLIEDHSGQDDSPIARHLSGRGYEHCTWFAWNRLFVRSDDPEMLRRAKDIYPNPPSATGRS